MKKKYIKVRNFGEISLNKEQNKREANFQLESSALNTFDDMDTHVFQGTPEEYRYIPNFGGKIM